MGTVLKDALLAELEPATVELADLRVAGGRIVARGHLTPEPDDEVISLGGKLVLPGLVSAHHWLSGSLLRGAPRQGKGFEAEREARRRLAAALTLDDVEAAAGAGAVEGLVSGTTTVLSLHSSPGAVTGSLDRVAAGLSKTGLRGLVAYQVSDEGGPDQRAACFDEAIGFSRRAKGRLRGALALSALDAITDDTLSALGTVQRDHGLYLLSVLAEDRNEEARSIARWSKPPIDRLFDAELVTERAVFAQGVHLSWPDLSRLLATGCWMAHTSRSNMSSQAGLATAVKFGVRACLGTDVMPLDMLTEAQVAWMRAADSGQPIEVLRFLANGHRLVSEVFGVPCGLLREGALADLVVFDYEPPTALNAQTLAAHLVQGLSSRAVESVMIDGVWRLWRRRVLGVEVGAVAHACREAAAAVWARMVNDSAAPSSSGR